MKKSYYFTLAIICACAFLDASEKSKSADSKDPLSSHREKLSYCLGQIIGEKITSGDIDLDVDVFIASLRDHISGKKPKLNKEQMNAVMNIHNKENFEKKKVAMKLQAEKGVEYMKKNGKNPEVTTTKSGVQYKVIKKGEGALPKVDDVVKMHYTGKLVSGKIFDTSRGKAAPIEMRFNRTVPGLIEAIRLMPVGSKWEIVIPSQLGYGQNPDVRSGILPNEILIFEVELFGILKAPIKK